jgi:hypothetical protein
VERPPFTDVMGGNIRALRKLTVCVWMVPLILVFIMIGGNTSHSCWIRIGCRIAYLLSLQHIDSMG